MPLGYGFGSCMTIDCPRGGDPALPLSMSKEKMYQDATGGYWCPLCSKRGELIDWASANGWPAVRVQGDVIYALAGSSADWFSTMVMASSAMVTALYETLIEHKREQIPLDAVNEGAERVRAWLAAFREAEDELERRRWESVDSEYRG